MGIPMKEEIELLKQKGLLADDDVLYMIRKKKKFSMLEHVINIFSYHTYNLVQSVNDNRILFLVASSSQGIIYEIVKKNIISIMPIESWESDMKDNFKSVVIDSNIYKKTRKV